MTEKAPRMVDRWRRTGSFQPVDVQRARMYGFVFLSKKPDNLRETCARWLTDPTGGVHHYAPALPLVLVTFAQLGRVSAADPPFRDVGWATETEATIWIPTSVLPVELFAPYIFVDLPFAISQGREIYGFPKEIGWFPTPAADAWHADPPDGPQADAFTLDVFGARRFGPEVQFTRQRLLRVARAPLAQSPIAKLWRSLEDAATELQREIFDGPLDDVTDELQRQLSGGRWWLPIGRTVLLKQFWDSLDGARACYQALVQAPIELVDFDGGWRLRGDYRLELEDLESHPLTRDLGLEAGQKALFGYWADLRFRLGRGTVLWKAP